MKLITKVKIAVTILLVSIIVTTFKSGTTLYNKSIDYKADYIQKTQEQIALYDAKYLSFVEQSNLTNVNKETFVQVTNIIMSARKDGENLAWKWLTENQPIPYSEFTSFYHELSNFVRNQYTELFAIEKSKQIIAAEHNKMIKYYPNNIYNWFINIKPIEYEFGYVSDKTKKLFNK